MVGGGGGQVHLIFIFVAAQLFCPLMSCQTFFFLLSHDNCLHLRIIPQVTKGA